MADKPGGVLRLHGVSSAARTEHLVTAADLARDLATDEPPVLLDVRWRLGDAPGAGGDRYAAGHLPGARFLDLEAVLTRHTDDPLEGRHPLPDVKALTAGLAVVGVRDGSSVVVYDEAGSFAAERAWWVLRWAGVRARVLDGGISAWTEAGGPVDTGSADRPTTAPEPASDPPLTLTLGHLPTLDADTAATVPDHGVLVDARAAERYRGEVEPMDPRAGHIPGAVNHAAATLFTPDGRLPDDASIRTLLHAAAVGEGPVAVYCGSGVSAARNLLALATLGVDGALFPGSWSAWSSDPDRPVATGPDPSPGRSGPSGSPSSQTLDSPG